MQTSADNHFTGLPDTAEQLPGVVNKQQGRKNASGGLKRTTTNIHAVHCISTEKWGIVPPTPSLASYDKHQYT